MIGGLPAEYGWLVYLLAPLVGGVLVGVVAKRALKLALALLMLILVLAGFMYTQLPDLRILAVKAKEILPQLLPWIQTGGGSLLYILPYSSAMFLIGLVLGLWRG